MSNLKATIEYKKGEVYLCAVSYNGLVKALSEVEIIAVSVEGRAVQIRTDDKDDSWEDVGEFHKTVRAFLGRYKTVGWWLWKKRVLVNVGKSV